MHKPIFNNNFISCESNFPDSKIVLFGAPYDGTTSNRPGTRFAPFEIRRESYGLETYSILQDSDLSNCKIYDAGNLEFPFASPETVLKIINDYTSYLLDHDKIPLMIGGEHLITLGAFFPIWKKFPDCCIIHFDAHADLRDDYLGDRLSHACVMRRCFELNPDSIFQFGIRSGDREEIIFARQNPFFSPFNFEKLNDAVNYIKNKNLPVYFSLDLDVMDTSVFGATGTPEPGGVSYNELEQAVLLLKNLDIKGVDICEYSPPYDTDGSCAAVSAKILREILLLL